MATGWLKIEKTLPDKPEVALLSEHLGIDVDSVVGKLVRFWSWFDDHTKNGDAPSVTKVTLDRATGATGFCKAMVAVGWMHEANGMLSLPKFDRHNSQTSKTRALTSKRTDKGRDASVVTTASLEEEKILLSCINSKGEILKEEIGLPFRSSEFQRAWSEWIEYRVERRLVNWKPVTYRAKFAEMFGWGEAAAIESIRQSIANGWQGLFEPKANGRGGKQSPTAVAKSWAERRKERSDDGN